MTAAGYLMDARFTASMLSGFAVTWRGLVNMGILPDGAGPTLPPKAKQKNESRPKYKELPGEADALEGGIPLGRMIFGSDVELSGEFFRGIAQVMRGMYSPGLHLALLPDGENSGAITTRLQEGRQYMDIDPETVFARYGVGAQDWTVVGTVGHHPLPDPDMANPSFVDDLSGQIRRGEFGRYLNQLGTMLGNMGFTDVAQAPGFTIVPWAVYRTIGKPAG